MGKRKDTMTTKTYTVAGTSNLNGVTKVRFANDLSSRVSTLVKNGHEDIRMIELPRAMTKTEACRYIYEAGQFQNTECQEAIETWVVNNGDTREFIKSNADTEPKIVKTFQKEEFEPDF
jgi:hypothetical protein